MTRTIHWTMVFRTWAFQFQCRLFYGAKLRHLFDQGNFKFLIINYSYNCRNFIPKIYSRLGKLHEASCMVSLIHTFLIWSSTTITSIKSSWIKLCKKKKCFLSKSCSYKKIPQSNFKSRLPFHNQTQLELHYRFFLIKERGEIFYHFLFVVFRFFLSGEIFFAMTDGKICPKKFSTKNYPANFPNLPL